MKLLALMSGLFVFWSIYFTIEMAFCNTDEKVLLADPDEDDLENSDSFVDPAMAPQLGSTTGHISCIDSVLQNNSK